MELTAERLLSLADDVVIRNMLSRRIASTYEEFRETLSNDLISVLQKLEDNPQACANDSEDETTQKIINMLECMGYTARHNAQQGGNVDITVEVTRRNFKWLGEAKKFEDVGSLREGYLQLATRYRSGMDEAGVLHGGLIAYLRRPNAAACMDEPPRLSWRLFGLSQTGMVF